MARVTTKSVLEDAKEVVQSKGWVQNTLCDGTRAEGVHGYCARGALALAAGAEPRFPDYPQWHEEQGHDRYYIDMGDIIHVDEYHAAGEILDEVVGNYSRIIEGEAGDEYDEAFDCVEDYNDEPGRTLEEVLAVFDQAIALAS